jgi:sRNA-binding carbon storage regulator CsrA
MSYRKGVQVLILSRNKNESLILFCAGRAIRLKITGASGKVQIGIDAPDDVKITREELVDGRCFECGGRGKLSDDMDTTYECPDCRGTGWKIKRKEGAS